MGATTAMMSWGVTGLDWWTAYTTVQVGHLT